eukprot:3145401-Rhodomonas_salina.2
MSAPDIAQRKGRTCAVATQLASAPSRGDTTSTSSPSSPSLPPFLPCSSSPSSHSTTGTSTSLPAPGASFGHRGVLKLYAQSRCCHSQPSAPPKTDAVALGTERDLGESEAVGRVEAGVPGPAAPPFLVHTRLTSVQTRSTSVHIRNATTNDVHALSLIHI